jgi:EmrB/QacA subfamily drug resistance transporter
MKDPHEKWYAMAAIAMGIFLSTIDASIVNIALPTLVKELHTTFALVEWVTLAYLLTVTTLMLTVGRLGDMMGKKPLYNAGFIIFIIGSALCGLSQDIYALIGFRVLQAVGAAMEMALGAAIVTEIFPPSERGKALGITGSIVSIGVITGPTIGGLIIDSLSWHWIFFVNVPIGLIGSAMVARFVPSFKPAGSSRFDFPGAATLFLSLISLLLGLSIGQNEGFTHPHVLMLFGGFLVFAVLFVFIEKRSPEPIINLSLFRNSVFTIELATGFLCFLCLSGNIFLMPFYLQNVLGLDPSAIGLLLAIVPLLTGIIAPISGSASDRYGSRLIASIGLLVLLGGFISLSTITEHTTPMQYILISLPIGLGLGIFQSPNNSAIMGSVPRNHLGVASGLLSMSRTMGQTTGIAVLSALWASRVAVYAQQPLTGGATTAPIAAQVAGLHDNFHLIWFLLGLAFLLSLIALLQEKRQHSTTTESPLAQ